MRTIGWMRGRIVAGGLLAAAAFAFAGAAKADPDGCTPPIVASGRLAPLLLPAGTIRPVLTFASGSGAEVVLAGVLAPADAPPALRRALASAVAALGADGVQLRAERARPDRRGRLVGAIETADGRSIQVALLAAGLVVAEPDAGPCAAPLRAAETEARMARRGLWAQTLPRPADASAAGLPDFLVVAGTVRSVGKSGATTYLNFGRRFADDLTVRLAPKVAAALAAAGTPAETLVGRRILVRGWAEPRNGIDMALASAAALELDEGTKAR